MRRSLWKSTEGTSAVELGLILPLLMMVLLGIIDYGHVYFARLTMTNAAREGARVGVTRVESEAQVAAETAARAYLDRAGLAGTVQATAPSAADPTVTVEITLEPFDPLIGFVPTPDRLRVSATMRWELAPAP